MSTARSTYWSLTINNPTDSDEECINLARQKGWTVTGQKEVGKEGTPHYQLMLKTPQLRCSAIKKMFPRGHIEIARNPAALEQYVQKDDTRIGELREQSDAYPSLSKYWTLIFDDNRNEFVDRLMRMNKDQLLAYLDLRTSHLIAEGYHVETIAVNPQVRCAFHKFAPQLHRRCQLSLQPDRQTDTVENSIDIPTNADETQAPSTPEGEEDDASSGSEDSGSEGFSESEYQEV
nr:MAG: replication associated protein [Cressdnaviricota sp.]